MGEEASIHARSMFSGARNARVIEAVYDALLEVVREPLDAAA
jgi:hypothetical protein